MRTKLLTGALAVFSSWLLVLATNGELPLFSHPRYTESTVVAALVLLAFLLWTAFRKQPEGENEEAGASDKKGTLAAGGVAVIVALTLLVAPAPVSAPTVAQVSGTSGETFSTVDRSEWSFRDWSTALQASVPFTAQEEVTLSGSVTAASDEDTFYLTRSLLRCCTVDLTPLYVPVHLPGWQATYEAGTWVEVTGTFTPSTSLTFQQVLTPIEVTAITPPQDPYEY